jgi:ABC-type branched-subunit amino acid transport system substrate-binding protein
VSFVGTDALAGELGADGEGVIVSQVVPFPQDRSVPLVAAYQDALARFGGGAKPGFVSLEGYLAGRLVVEALGRVSGEPTRATLLDAIYGGGAFDLGGVRLEYGPGDSQGMDEVFLTELDGSGGVRPVARLQS